MDAHSLSHGVTVDQSKSRMQPERTVFLLNSTRGSWDRNRITLSAKVFSYIRRDLSAAIVSLAQQLLMQSMARKCVRLRESEGRAQGHQAGISDTPPSSSCSLDYTAAITGTTNMETCWGPVETKGKKIPVEKRVWTRGQFNVDFKLSLWELA